MSRTDTGAVLLREATTADLPALLDVQEVGAVTGLGHLFPQERYPFPREALRARWTAEIADPAVAAYVVDDAGGRLVGFAATRDDELLHFGTAVQTWGNGLAAAVHDEVLRRLAASGVSLARLSVFEGNTRARRFYTRLGWRQTSRRRRTTFPPHPVLLEYERDLPGPDRLAARSPP